MTVQPDPWAPQELRALLAFDTRPPGHISVPVTRGDLAPHLRPGEFAIIDPTDREPVAGELFLVAWTGGPDRDGFERTRLVQAFRRDHVCHGKPFTAWWVGSLRRPPPYPTYEEALALIRAGRQSALGWSNGPYGEGVLEHQLRGRVVGLLAPTFEEPKRLPQVRGRAA